MAGKRTRSMGEMISTVCFFGMSAWILLEALALLGQVPKIQVWGLFCASFMCFLGGLRFVIADVAEAVRRRFSK
ncbi:hypothetical protein [uncultured Lentibacter sp.]|jgi:hypothetical protein|uniref:hypothetical protein n=1 Tax=uncultured Lentibacter sp. TaxID=1659309 RepID=UPI0026319963|nr:hypothetical protein [uncultured Lentibacter sp.]